MPTKFMKDLQSRCYPIDENKVKIIKQIHRKEHVSYKKLFDPSLKNLISKYSKKDSMNHTFTNTPKIKFSFPLGKKSLEELHILSKKFNITIYNFIDEAIDEIIKEHQNI